MAEYSINKGINRPAEFKGLKSQYLYIFAGGLLSVFVVFEIIHIIGIDQWICIGFELISASLLIYTTFKMNEKYGTHGLMKLMTRLNHPKYIINRKAANRLFSDKRERVRNDCQFTYIYFKSPV